jgi:predicted Fe-S protein YdhL (DUF1289 family)
MPIRFTTDDMRSAEQAATDDRTREEVERGGGVWAQMTQEQRAQVTARLRDKKQRAQAARARKAERTGKPRGTDRPPRGEHRASGR